MIPIMYYSRYCQDENDQEEEPVSRNINDKIQQNLKVTALTLDSEYKKSGESADNIYKGNILDVSGVFGGVKKDVYDEKYLSFINKNKYLNVHAYMKINEIKKATNIKKRTAITVTCEGDGIITGTVILKNCTTD